MATKCKVPEFWAVRIDETEYWVKDFLAKNGIRRIWGIYVYNRTLGVHCCEFLTSRELHVVDYDWEPVHEIDDDRELDRIDQEITDAFWKGTDPVCYMHVSTVDRLPHAPIVHKCGPGVSEEEALQDAIEWVATRGILDCEWLDKAPWA